MCLSKEHLERKYWKEAKGWIVDGAGGWPQAWLDTEEETMKGRLSSAPQLLLCTGASQLTAARLSLRDPPRYATCLGNDRGSLLAKLDESSAAPPEPASALLPERSAWKSPCRELREQREWGLGSRPVHSVRLYPIHTQCWC